MPNWHEISKPHPQAIGPGAGQWIRQLAALNRGGLPKSALG